MDFSLTPEQLELKDRIARFADENLNDNTLADDEGARFPVEKWRACAEFGILGFNVPEEYGGGGLDNLTTVIGQEALGYGCRENGLPFAIASQVWSVQTAILEFGTEDQKRKYLPALCSGSAIGAFGITEAGSGSDTYGMSTRAGKSDDGYVLDGRKSYITNAPVCDIAVVFAVTNPDEGRWGISGFIVEAGMDGFERGPVRSKMGMRTTQMGDLILNHCLVPESNRLGAEGAGVSMFSRVMEAERGFIFATQVGRMERQLEESIDYARDRQAFDKSIGKFQSVSNRIVDMKVRLEAARLILYRLAWLTDTGRPVSLDAAITKLLLSETFVESSLDAIRTFGAKGYVSEFEVERDLRDAVGGLIYSGTSDVQREIVARLLGL